MASDSKFWDRTKLLNMRDLDNKKPEIYMVSGNRTAGKTFGFKEELIESFLGNGEEFIIYKRYGADLKGSANSFWRDIGSIKYPDKKFEEQCLIQNAVYLLKLDDKICGYTVALNNPTKIKDCSTQFYRVGSEFLDEFQREDGKYIPNEIDKLQNCHWSVARGGGSHTRYVRTLLSGNNVSIINPYFMFFGISTRLRKETKFMRGNGWVAEFTFNQAAADEMLSSGYARAFKNSGYLDFAAQNVYLNDNETFVENVPGNKRLVATLVKDGKSYGLWDADYFYYLSKKTDPGFKNIVSLDILSHTPGARLLSRSDILYDLIKEAFNRGLFRFQDLECKSIIFELLSY